MTNTNIVKIGHSKLAEARVSGVYAARYNFRKRRLYTERDGSTSEVPYSQELYLLKLPGEARVLWLTPAERQRVMDALQEVEPLHTVQSTLVVGGEAV